MTLNIFNDMWNGLVKFTDKCHDFIMDNYDEPFLWLILFGILLMVGYYAINKFATK